MKKLLKLWLLIAVSVTIYVSGNYTAYAVGEDDFIISEDGNLSEYNGSDTIVSIPNTVKTIDSYAFKGCSTVEQIIIPEGVTTINYDAFSECTNLNNITIPSSITSMSFSAFNGCTSLKEITIPKLLTDINWYSFNSSENSIEKVHIASENTAYSSIDGIVYNKAKTSLLLYPSNRKDESFTIPDSVTDISDARLYKAIHLKHLGFNESITMKKEDYELNGSHFLNGALESFSVPEANKSFCDINGVLFSKDKKTLIAYPEKKEGVVYKIPDGTERIYQWSLSRDENSDIELRYILFPSSIKTIDPCTGFVAYLDGLGPNKDLVFFGEKDSVVESYAKTNELKFGIYKASNKDQLLISISSLIFFTDSKIKAEAILASSGEVKAVTWKSSDSSISSIDKKGNITIKKVGTVRISASVKNGLSATFDMLVKLPSPSNLKITKGSPASVDLSWDKVSGAESYTLYRSNFFDEPYTKQGTTKKLTLSDKKVKEGATYFYKIQANHSNATYHSELSSPHYVAIPNSAKKVSVTQDYDVINIDWTINDYVDGISIYRSTSKTGKYTKLADSSSSDDGYKDDRVKKGNTYYYKIRMFYQNDNTKIYSSDTEPVGIKVK